MTAMISYKHISLVIESWELARQRFGNEEQVGTTILIHLFTVEPETKRIFGFRPDQDIAGNPMLKMGVLVHGAQVIQMLDGILDLLGQDTDLLEQALGPVGEQHCRLVGTDQPEYFELLGQAIRMTLMEILGDRFTPSCYVAWTEAFRVFSSCIVPSRAAVAAI
jgi:hemoglobin-like flavoprotein